MIYASVDCPGRPSSVERGTAAVTTYHGTSSSHGNLSTGISYTDYTDEAWTDDWVLNITLTSLPPTKRATLVFKHGSKLGSSSDFGIDRVLVLGGTCGTGVACACRRGQSNPLAEQGDLTNNDKAQLGVVEAKEGLAPGYADFIEVPCAQCMVQASEGAIYTRWGAGTCPAGQNTIYSGFMGGSVSSSNAGAGQYVCLTSVPRLGAFNKGDQAGVNMARVEYAALSASTLQGLEHYDAVCSVCQASGRAWSLTVNGRQDCPSNFTLDYAGYLMSERHNAWRTEYICVSAHIEAVPSSSTNSPSAELWQAETDGALGPYTDDKEVTCAQCSSNVGPTYVRWGRSDCPVAATLLYAGRAAGSHYADQGGGHNYVCLHGSPAYNETTAAQQAGARLYHAEYETEKYGLKGYWHVVAPPFPLYFIPWPFFDFITPYFMTSFQSIPFPMCGHVAAACVMNVPNAMRSQKQVFKYRLGMAFTHDHAAASNQVSDQIARAGN